MTKSQISFGSKKGISRARRVHARSTTLDSVLFDGGSTLNWSVARDYCVQVFKAKNCWDMVALPDPIPDPIVEDNFDEPEPL